ncbi:SMC3 [Candida oxycetoniae]|uniref:Structural maintenance of chromosomes protein n=1 Tax=Candida oxycetoniae TaxID=497107 RepID=A0AAI9WX60_9ASCO|nr:SMC3 [Candida oxycetoniae]KAI3403976.2 SMC3 [Candida oxycetoniae]
MHIKKIVIQGFKTYKNLTTIDLLSPHCNVVVGRNGSGKSNFFAAIRFVLSDAYTHMTREERQALIHDGSGTIMSAYVEVVFDNSDGRFPINNKEISIRRTIGLKKDDYSLDGKSATRSDVMHLLESAGFSRSNPYYIVPQGRITSLTNSKDHERLALLKEVSGATVFENKLKDSMKEMAQSNLKRQRIDEALESIQDRISDLQIESADLKDFQNLEKEKKVLEYNIFDRELIDLTQSIETLEEKYQSLMLESQIDLDAMEKREKLCINLQNSIKDLNVNLKVSSSEKEEAELEYDQLLKQFANKEIKVNELREIVESSDEKYKELENKTDYNRKRLLEINESINSNKPRLLTLQEKESKLKQKLSELNAEQRALYSKQYRFQKYDSKEQRDSWLTKEISKLKKESRLKEQEMQQLQIEIAKNESSKQKLLQRKSEVDGFLNDDDDHYSKRSAELKHMNQELKLKISNCVDQRKVLWRDEVRLKSVFDSLTNDLINATNSVNQTMDRAQSQGIAAVNSIVHRLQLEDKVYGTIAELFNINDKYKTAAEVIAGTSLFHVVVDTDATAALIIEELNRTKAGRVTFIPLNRISVSNVDYPESSENQCIPLISKIRYDEEKVGKAIRQIFGKALVVKDLYKGAELSRKFKLTGITLDGDRVDIKGVVSGGYRDYKSSRIDVLKLQSKTRLELEKTETELKSIGEKITKVNQEITSLNNELQLNIRDLDKLSSSREPFKLELASLTSKIFNVDQVISSLKSNLASVEAVRNLVNSNVKHHEQELDSEFSQALSEKQSETLSSLNAEISTLESSLDEIVTESLNLESKINELENTAENLQLEQGILLQQSISLGDRATNQQDLNELEQEYKFLSVQLEETKTRITKSTEIYQKICDEIAENEVSLERANKQQVETMKNFEKLSKNTTKLLNQKSIKEQTKEDINKKIRELGMLPEEAFHAEEYIDFTSNDLVEKLNRISEDLVKYSHINKKAMEQFNQFTKQRDDLISRRDDLDVSKRSIENLIKNLQQQKKDAIMNSFKQVAKSFNEIFEKLVPRGVGHLILQKKTSPDTQTQGSIRDDGEGEEEEEVDDDDDYDNEKEDGNDDSIENYTGVAISVSFNSKDDEQQKIEQLSGGQKSLCAIALIFAIQNCDPAPFYLFDEIDSNLDTQYRTSVASLIKSLSSEAQFICTTFRPELLSLAADKFYGVVFANKVSNIIEIDKEEAMNFVEGQAHS